MDNFPMKRCSVMLENCTPKKQVGLSAEIHHEIQERNMLTTRTKEKILTDLSNIKATDIENNKKVQRDKTLSEIISSETSYLKQLAIVRDFFMTPLQCNIITNDEYNTLFCNIKTINTIASELLRELKKEGENVAEAFSKIAPFFKHYSVYAYHYKQSLEMLQNLSVKNREFAKFLEMQESRPEVQSKLSALLITPIQRVPRYCLLLKQLVANTSPSHSSYLQLTELLKRVELAAVHINSLIEDQESAQLLLEFQRSLEHGFPSIVRPGRKLLKKGVLTVLKQPNNNKKCKKCFVLLSDILMYCKVKKTDINLPNSLKCSGIFPLHKCKIIENLHKGAFTICCEDESIVVYHEHADEIGEWFKVINSRIREYINDRRTLRKDSSARRPVVHKRNISEYQEVGVSPGIPRRKRFIDDLVGNNSQEKECTDDSKTCFSLRPVKRKSTRDYSAECTGSKVSRTTATKQQDCLYPLRELVAQRSNMEDSDLIQNEIGERCTAIKNDSDANNGQVFVFGTNTRPRGFRFNMMNVLTDIGSSLKRLFGIHN